MIARSSPPMGTVVVVGAGPAGATAARTLASAGVPVRVLDRAPAFPRNKPCGGGISMRALRRFPYLERELARIATHVLSRLHLEGPDGSSALVESDEPAALMIRRIEFDALLVSLAVDAGAAIVGGVDIVQAREDATGVTLLARDGRRFTAPLVIAADGVHSIVGRRLGLNPGWAASSVALDMMEESPRTALRDVDPSTLWVAYGYSGTDYPRAGYSGTGFRTDDGTETRPPDPAETGGKHRKRDRESPETRPPYGTAEGYAYIFPKRDHVNIGIGYVLSYYREQVDAAPYALQRDFIDRLRARGIVVGDSVRANFTPFLIPIGGPLRRPARGRVLLAGDAGGFVNGFTAEGIYYAMVSGELAARAVIESAGDPGRAAARYCRVADYEIGRELRDSILIQRYLFADSRRIAQAISGANRERALTRLVLDLAIGRRSYAEVRRKILVRSPALLARMVIERMKKRPLPAAAAITRM